MNYKLTSLAALAAIALAAHAAAVENNKSLFHKDQTSSTRSDLKSSDPFPPQGNTGLDALTYPFRELGRAGNSLTHSRSIMSETMHGDRQVIQSNGKVFSHSGMTYKDMPD